MKLSTLCSSAACTALLLALPQISFAGSTAGNAVALDSVTNAPIARRGADDPAGHNANDDRGRGRGGRGRGTDDGPGHR